MSKFPLEWFTGHEHTAQRLNVIPYGSHEPDREGRYIDRNGDIWEWAEDEEAWANWFVLFGRLTADFVPWEGMEERDMPWTEMHA